MFCSGNDIYPTAGEIFAFCLLLHLPENLQRASALPSKAAGNPSSSDPGRLELYPLTLETPDSTSVSPFLVVSFNNLHLSQSAATQYDIIQSSQRTDVQDFSLKKSKLRI